MSAKFLTVAEVAERLRVSSRSIHERTRRDEIPYWIAPGTRKCLFALEDLERYECGDFDRLERRELPANGRVVFLVGGAK